MVDLIALDELEVLPHEFELDVNCLVVTNYRSTLDRITLAEKEDLSAIGKPNGAPDSEVTDSVRSYISRFYNDLRRGAHQLALGGLLTRLEHWVAQFVKRYHLQPAAMDASLLLNQLTCLNLSLGPGPVPIRYFRELLDLRDCILYGDSKAVWKQGPTEKRVAGRFLNPHGEVELSAKQLDDAIEQAVRQITWYDARLHPVH